MSQPSQRWWSWMDVLAHAPRLGIPHFQRGQVWEASHRSALLLSLYERSPCGSFVLWESTGDDPARHGVPLLECQGATVSSDVLWLVDGQQRTRTLVGVSSELAADEALVRTMGLQLVPDSALRALSHGAHREAAATAHTDDAPSSDNEDVEPDDDAMDMPFVWFAVLPSLAAFSGDTDAVFAKEAELATIRRGGVFRRLRLRSKRPRRAPNPRGMVPLAVLLQPQDSVLLDAEAAARVLEMLEAPKTHADALDELLPWGPQYLTGFAFTDESDQLQPLRWRDILRRSDDNRAEVAWVRALFEPRYREALEAFSGMMLAQQFAVGHLPSSTVADAIEAYVRINRAGIRVTAEERALAVLTRAGGDLVAHLREFCDHRDEVHRLHVAGATASASAPGTARSLLAHGADRKMGFPLWMTVVARYCALDLVGAEALNWLDADVVDRWTFVSRMDALGNDVQDIVVDAAGRASAALVLLDDVLSRELWFDHRMARPNPNALRPLLDLFAHLSADELNGLRGDEGFRKTIAAVLVFTMHHPYLDKAEMKGLVKAIHMPVSRSTEDDAEMRKGVHARWLDPAAPMFGDWRRRGGDGSELGRVVSAALGRYVVELRRLWSNELKLGAPQPTDVVSDVLSDLTTWSIAAFSKQANEATSLRHPAVGWLYALERRGGATEFDWRTQFEARSETTHLGIAPWKGGDTPQTAPMLGGDRVDATLAPERQHIVPFADAKKLCGKDGGTRATASPANGVGNVTWLSARQNSFDTGFGDAWAVFDDTVEFDNLRARGLVHTDEHGQRAVDAYRELRQSWFAPGGKRSDDTATFERFTQLRREWMAHEMAAWLAELANDVDTRWLRITTPP